MSRMQEKSGGKKIGEKLLVGGAAFMVAVGGAACGNDANATPVEQEDTSAGSGPVEEGIVPNVDDYLPEDVTIDGDEPEEYPGEEPGEYTDEEPGAPDKNSPEYKAMEEKAYAEAERLIERGVAQEITKIEVFPQNRKIEHGRNGFVIHYINAEGEPRAESWEP